VGSPLRRRPEIHDRGPGFGAPRSSGAKNGNEPMWTGFGTAGTIPSTSDSWGTWVPHRTVHGWPGVKLRRRTLTFRNTTTRLFCERWPLNVNGPVLMLTLGPLLLGQAPNARLAQLTVQP
jgi:hypothetical protein